MIQVIFLFTIKYLEGKYFHKDYGIAVIIKVVYQIMAVKKVLKWVVQIPGAIFSASRLVEIFIRAYLMAARRLMTGKMDSH